MSLLANFLRSLFTATGDPARTLQAQGGEPAAASRAGNLAPAGATDTSPAWRLLEAQAGVQDLDYGDHARTGIQHLFGHRPRRVLDIGCATGAVGAGLKQADPDVWVWGCELNERAARVAATRLDHVTPVARAQWPESDLALLKSVDTVLLLDVLEHMYNPWAELEHLAAHLPDDAQVIVSLPHVAHLSVLTQLAKGRFDYQPMGILDVTHIRFFTLPGMHEMFDQTGFAVEGQWVLGVSHNIEIESFPTQVQAGKLRLMVESAAEWERLNVMQYGFRLAKKRGAHAAHAEGSPPAWRLLAAQAGVQEHDYGEGERLGVRELFGHAPRRVLDIGCAAGAIGAGMKRSMPGLWVWGCELNERAARVAATRLDHVTTVPREQWSAADRERVAGVDTVLLLNVLEHMYNPWAELEFLSANLPPDAQVIVSLPNIGYLWVIEALSRGEFQYLPAGVLDVTHIRFFTLDTMREMFEQTGFEIEAIAVLGGSDAKVERFPAPVACGKVQLTVEGTEEWMQLNATQFGFRLRPRPRPAAAAPV